jgi:hypothetical protein
VNHLDQFVLDNRVAVGAQDARHLGGGADEHVGIAALAAAVVGSMPRGEVVDQLRAVFDLAIEEHSLGRHEDVVEDDHRLATHHAEAGVTNIAAALELS